MPQFILYLVTRSWKKMRRRIRHWSSQGFIYYLSEVDETTLRAAVEPAAPLRNDALLSAELIAMDRKNTLHDPATNTITGTPSATTSLLTACRDMQNMPTRARRAQPGEQSGLYNRATCFEFHQLLVSILLRFGKALDGYAAAKSFEDLLKSAKEVNRCGTLLWYIGYSRILENHLKVLHKKKLLYLPVKSPEDLEKFFTFTGFARTTKTQVIPRLTDEVDGGADDAGNSDEGGVEGVDDCGNEVGTNEDREFRVIVEKAVLSGSHDLYTAFLEWIRLQVDRFQAARKITSFMKRTRTPRIDLTLLAIRRTEPKPVGDVMEPWGETIKDLCARAPGFEGVDPGEIILILEEKIRQGVQETPKDSIFHKFSGKTYDYNAAVHCEAALAAIEQFPGAVVCDDAVREHIQNFDNSIISVSELCCPVCWELIKILRNKKSTNFHLDGHHKTLSQVELPEWLPLQIVEKLTARFEDILSTQIETLMPRRKRRAINPSGQSRNDLSSNSSEGEEDARDAIGWDDEDLPCVFAKLV